MGLERNGFVVDAFNDPRKAIEEFKPNFYDMLILDIMMPQMTGFELYRELRAKDQDVSISLLTAFDVYYKDFPKMFPDMKVDKLMKKPIGINELVAFLRSREPAGKNQISLNEPTYRN
jgi:two-component system, OmpR family, response regulator ChvI